jgi:hypothetical protein
MKEYKVFQVSSCYEDTQAELNELAKEGWKLICSYCGGSWLIMERDIKVCKKW